MTISPDDHGGGGGRPGHSFTPDRSAFSRRSHGKARQAARPAQHLADGPRAQRHREHFFHFWGTLHRLTNTCPPTESQPSHSEMT